MSSLRDPGWGLLSGPLSTAIFFKNLCVCVCVHECMYICTWESEDNLMNTVYLLWDMVPCWPELTDYARLAGSPCLLPQCCDYKPHTTGFLCESNPDPHAGEISPLPAELALQPKGCSSHWKGLSLLSILAHRMPLELNWVSTKGKSVKDATGPWPMGISAGNQMSKITQIHIVSFPRTESVRLLGIIEALLRMWAKKAPWLTQKT